MDGLTHEFGGGASRRRFLGTVAAGTLAGAGGFAGVGGLAGAQSQVETIRLGGEVAGWQGRAPEGIAGTTNPTLELDAGQTYRITWENLDGMGHNVALLDGGGNVLQRTEVMAEEGATQTIEFTARERMAEYICEPHSTSMRGAIRFAGETATQTATETPTGGTDPYIPAGGSVRIETIADGGLDAPLDFEVPPGDARKFIVDRTGQVYVHTADGLRGEPFIDVSGQLAEISGEMGLLGMAFHPQFQRNGKFYLRYSAPPREGTPDDFSHTEVLAEFTASEDGSTGLVDSERTILEIPSPQNMHNSGAVTFGPADGYLYMGMGDGGGGSDDNLGHVEDWYEGNPGGNGQDVTENLLGSILRIDVDNQENGNPYAVPDDNPLVDTAGLPEQFAWGFRNPWRIGFSNGRLFAADVGQNGFEEVNVVRKGGNYGWNVREGTHCFRPREMESVNASAPAGDCPARLPSDIRGGERLISPVIEYPQVHEGRSVGSAVIGGYIYENDAVPAITGKYVFGDFRKNIDIETPSGSLFAATPSQNGQWSLEELTVTNGDSGRLGAFVLALGRDNAGELYVLTTSDPDAGEGSGAVHRIVPAQSSTRTATGNTTADNATAGNATAGNTTTGNVTDNQPTAAGDSPPTAAGTDAEPTESESGSAGAGTGAAASGENDDNGSGGTGGSGPGFGALAALSALGIGVARLLTRDDDR